MSEVHTHSVDYIPAEKLEYSPLNPPERTDESSVKSLIASIRSIGLQYPILVSPLTSGKYSVIDGNRRFKCLRDYLKWHTVPCIVSRGDPKKLFSGVSGTVKPLRAVDWLEVYVRGGDLPSSSTKNSIMHIERLLGKEGLDLLREHNASPAVYQTARRVHKYCEIPNDDDSMIYTLKWIVENTLSRQLSAAMSNQRSPDDILEARKNGTRI